VAHHIAVLYKFTDNTNAIIGSTSYSADNNNALATTLSQGFGTITIPSNKTFVIRHQCTVTNNSSGFGAGAGASFGVSNIFTNIKITKIR